MRLSLLFLYFAVCEQRACTDIRMASQFRKAKLAARDTAPAGQECLAVLLHCLHSLFVLTLSFFLAQSSARLWRLAASAHTPPLPQFIIDCFMFFAICGHARFSFLAVGPAGQECLAVFPYCLLLHVCCYDVVLP